MFDLASGGGKFHQLQPVGFALMLCGTTIYNENIRLPGFYYPSDEEKQKQQASRPYGTTVPGLLPCRRSPP